MGAYSVCRKAEVLIGGSTMTFGDINLWFTWMNRARPPLTFTAIQWMDITYLFPILGWYYLGWDQWKNLSQRLVGANTQFAIEPHIRFKGKPGEQATMFFYDPSGNALEFKAFKDLNQLFAK